MTQFKNFSSRIIFIVFLTASIFVERSSLSVAASQSVDEVALSALMEKYMAAYAKKDLAVMVTLWSVRSQDLAQTFEKLQESFNAEDYTFSNLRVSNIKITNHRAALQIAA